MHEVLVGAVWLLKRNRNRDALFLGEVDEVDAALEFVEKLLVLPRRIDFEVGSKCCIRELEAYLVVAFSSRAMADVVCTIFTCYLYLLFGDNRTRE